MWSFFLTILPRVCNGQAFEKKDLDFNRSIKKERI